MSDMKTMHSIGEQQRRLLDALGVGHLMVKRCTIEMMAGCTSVTLEVEVDRRDEVNKMATIVQQYRLVPVEAAGSKDLA